jgi:hypothetical protein
VRPDDAVLLHRVVAAEDGDVTTLKRLLGDNDDLVRAQRGPVHAQAVSPASVADASAQVSHAEARPV